MQENVLYDLIGRQDKGLATAYQVRVWTKMTARPCCVSQIAAARDLLLHVRVKRCSLVLFLAGSAQYCAEGSSPTCMAAAVSVCVWLMWFLSRSGTRSQETLWRCSSRSRTAMVRAPSADS